MLPNELWCSSIRPSSPARPALARTRASISLITLAVAWHWEWVGGILFAALGIFYIISMWGRFPWSVYLVIAGPAFLLAALFLVNWFYREQIRAS